MKYNKLVRDKIPTVIKSKGQKYVIHIASKVEYEHKLLEKLSEEVKEFKEANNADELADILEVVFSLAKQKHITRKGLEQIRIKKKKERGSFTKKIILDEVL